LGDSIEKITKATKIDKLVKFVAGEDCGCDERKATLNKLFQYKRPICFTEEYYKYWTEFRNCERNFLTSNEADKLCEIWNYIFQTKKYYCPCRSCTPRPFQDMINDLNQVYKTYELPNS
jgi:hypothetical protein